MDPNPVKLEEIFQDSPKVLEELLKDYHNRHYSKNESNSVKTEQTEEDLLNHFKDLAIFPDDNFINTPAEAVPTILHTVDDENNVTPFMEKGIVAYLLGPSGVGKSHFLMQLSISIATGSKFLNKYIPTNSGKVIYILGEDRKKDGKAITTQNRMQIAMNSFFLDGYIDKRSAGYNYSKAILDKIVPDNDSHERKNLVKGIKNNLILVPMANLATQIQKGLRYTDMTDFDDLIEAEKTQFFFLIYAAIKEYKPELVILDPEVMFAGPDSELDPAAATRMIRMLIQLCSLPSEPTILISSHPNKSSAQAKLDVGSLRGSGARTAISRWTGIIDHYWPGTFKSKSENKEGETVEKKEKVTPQNREYICQKWVERLRLPKESTLLTFHVGNANESPSGEKTRINMTMWPGLDRRITRWPRLPYGFKDTSPPDEDWKEVNALRKESSPIVQKNTNIKKDSGINEDRIIDSSNLMEFLNEN